MIFNQNLPYYQPETLTSFTSRFWDPAQLIVLLW